MEWISRFRCRTGLHKWRYTHKNQYGLLIERYCQQCNRFEHRPIFILLDNEKSSAPRWKVGRYGKSMFLYYRKIDWQKVPKIPYILPISIED